MMIDTILVYNPWIQTLYDTYVTHSFTSLSFAQILNLTNPITSNIPHGISFDVLYMCKSLIL